MRAPTLQYLYLQKPLTFFLLIAALVFSPFISESGETLYQLERWAAFALSTSFVGYFFLFTGRRMDLKDTFASGLLLLSVVASQGHLFYRGFEMLHALLFVVGMASLYECEEEGIRPTPWIAIIALWLAAAIKGAPILLIGYLIWGIYLIVLRYPIERLIRLALVPFAASLAVLFGYLWTTHHYQLDTFSLSMGTAHPAWFYVRSTAITLRAWIVLLLAALPILFAADGRLFTKVFRPQVKAHNVVERITLFSIIAIGVSLITFSLLPEKKDENIIVIYPFCALLIGRFSLFLAEYKSFALRIFSWISLAVYTAISVGYIMVAMGSMDVTSLGWTIDYPIVQHYLQRISTTITQGEELHWFFFAINLFALGTLFYQLCRRINVKILFATIACFLAFSMLLNWTTLHAPAI